jgi:hypothetical protein
MVRVSEKICRCLARQQAQLHFDFYTRLLQNSTLRPLGETCAMEIVPPERLAVSGSISVGAKGIRGLEATPIVEGKLAGCKGCSVGSLLSRVTRVRGDPGISGIFVGADGFKTEPIAMEELVQGLIVHSDSAGDELPAKLGGPLRVVFPDGIKSQTCKVDGQPMAVNVKGCARLVLSSSFEATDASLTHELNELGPRIMLELNERERDPRSNAAGSLAAFATHFAGLADVTAASVTALDARGLTLTVTVETVLRVEKAGVLVPVPRPLGSAADVSTYLAEMQRASFKALGLGFRLRHGRAAALARRLPPWTAAAATVLVAAGALALALRARAPARLPTRARP